VWLSKHNRAPIAEHRVRSDAHPSEGDNVAAGGAVGFEPVPRYGTHTPARCGSLFDAPHHVFWCGTLGNKRPLFISNAPGIPLKIGNTNVTFCYVDGS
jgi:hypothetical protein